MLFICIHCSALINKQDCVIYNMVLEDPYKWTHTVQTYVVQRSTVYSKQKGNIKCKYSINNKIKSEWIK